MVRFEPIAETETILGWADYDHDGSLRWQAFGRCPIQVQSPRIQDITADKGILLNKDGTAAMTGENRYDLIEYSATLLESCAEDASRPYLSTKGVTSCETIDSPANCTSIGCGICSCTIKTGLPNLTTWAVKAAALAVNGGGTLPFCVEDDSLTIWDEGGAKYTFERVVLGTPTPCRLRTLAACGDDCRAGACEWNGSSTLVDATDCIDPNPDKNSCTSTFGCEWNAERCGGKAALECDPADFGQVPGCDFFPAGTKCQGTPTPCSELDGNACLEAPGCSLVAGCDGGTADCSEVQKRTNTCYGAWCSSDNSGNCLGTIDCSTVKSESNCAAGAGCTWRENVCAGTALPCENYSLGECTYRGCSTGL